MVAPLQPQNCLNRGIYLAGSPVICCECREIGASDSQSAIENISKGLQFANLTTSGTYTNHHVKLLHFVLL